MEEWELKKQLAPLCENGALTNDNVMKLFQQYHADRNNGIPKEESVARTLLIMGNIKLVYFVLKDKIKIPFPNESMDEFSIGKIGLMKSVDTYRTDTEAKFSSYAIKVISRDIFMHYRKINSVQNTINREAVSLDDVVQTPYDRNELTLEDMIADDENFVQEYEDRDGVETAYKNMKYLKPKEQIAIIYTFGLFGKPVLKQREIAEIVGTTRSVISVNLKRGLHKLKVLATSESLLTSQERILRYKLLGYCTDEAFENLLN